MRFIGRDRPQLWRPRCGGACVGSSDSGPAKAQAEETCHGEERRQTKRTADEARRHAEAKANEARGREEEARRAGARAGADGRSETRAATFDPYGVLRISRGASQETIRKAYRLRIAMYHPDKVDHLGEEFQQLASEKTREVIRAYEMLRTRVSLRERR
jgi:DnaJ-domain-containing protein 1